MVPINGVYIIYIANVKLKFAKIIVIKCPIQYPMLYNTKRCTLFPSKVGLYLVIAKCDIMLAHQSRNNIIAM
jgi:hypothetical protein